ncbi:MAG TPA: SCO family protein [Thermodesulfobacteriota bacterium]
MTAYALAALALVACLAGPARAHDAAPPVLEGIGIDERLGARLPLDLPFEDAAGRTVRLGAALDARTPVVLVLAYYRCAQLCPLNLRGVADGLGALGWRLGEQYRAVTVSIDPRDGPYDAGRQQQAVLARLGQPEGREAWPFLVGREPAIRAVADAVGFRYRYDPRSDQFAHAAAVVVLTPDGRVSRYLYGIAHEPRDLRLALLEASAGRTGSAVERFLMRCYRYDPATRRYGIYVLGVLRGGGAVVLVALGTLIGLLWRRERRREAAP